MIDKSKIAILSTVINFDLYFRSSPLFPDGIKKYVIDGRNGMYGIDSLCYMMKVLKDKNIEWLIMADEDVLFMNSKLVFPLIQEMAQNDIMFCGVRDGGMIKCRKQNPYVINTFFSIINFKELEKIWNKKKMLSNQYILDGEFKDDLSKLAYDFDAKSLYEYYYCFYFWLRRLNKKCLFLDSKKPFESDEMTNSVGNLKGDTILYHTWYARYYGINELHTERIEEVFSQIKIDRSFYQEPIIFKDWTFGFRNSMEKLRKRIINRINKI
jgi:hypothetical protein